MLPFIEAILLVFNIMRGVLLVVSFWKPNITRYYMLFQAIYTSIRELAPINLGDLADYNL